MSNYIRRYREEAGLTQEQFAEKMQVSTMAVYNWETGKTKVNPDKFNELSRIFNVPVERLIKEMLREEDKTRENNWPYFLFDDEINEIADTLHLNLAQQDLFGLMYIYTTDHNSSSKYGFVKEFDEKLKSIPCSFIEKYGSIQFINMAEGLKKVTKYIKPEFLMEVLKQNPESEFDVTRLSKERIIDFIERGSINPREIEPMDQIYEPFEFDINIEKAKTIFPILEKTGPVHLDEEWVCAPIKDEYPADLIIALLETLGINRSDWENGKYKKHGFFKLALAGIGSVTTVKNTAKKGKPEHWVWSINDKGRELLKWLNEQKN